MRTSLLGDIPLRRIAVLGLHGIALGLLALHLHVRRLPPTPTPIPEPHTAEAAWWGPWPITYAPGWFVWLGVLAVVLPVAVFWAGEIQNRRTPTVTDDVSRISTEVRRTWPWQLLLVAAGGLLLAAFFLFPSAHTRWGDAYVLARSLAWPDPALRLTHSWQAPADVRLHALAWQALQGPLGWPWKDATPVYRLLSPLAGALYLGVVLALSRRAWLAPPWLTFGLLASLGLLQLFFGYVENYSFAAAGVLAYLWLGLEVLARGRPLWWAATVLALTHAFHPSTVVLAPSLLFLAWQVARQGNQSWRAVVLEVAIPMLLVAGGVAAMMEAGGHGLRALASTDRPGGGDGRWFVPLGAPATRWEHYSMFSWPHLRDFVNQQLLVAPAALLSVLWLAGIQLLNVGTLNVGTFVLRNVQRFNVQRANVPTFNVLPFLSVAAGCALLFTWVWNPDYGGQRDWDLFSLAAPPVSLLLVALLPRRLGRGRSLWGAALPLIALQAWHTAAWIYQNTRPWEWP